MLKPVGILLDGVGVGLGLILVLTFPAEGFWSLMWAPLTLIVLGSMLIGVRELVLAMAKADDPSDTTQRR